MQHATTAHKVHVMLSHARCKWKIRHTWAREQVPRQRRVGAARQSDALVGRQETMHCRCGTFDIQRFAFICCCTFYMIYNSQLPAVAPLRSSQARATATTIINANTQRPTQWMTTNGQQQIGANVHAVALSNLQHAAHHMCQSHINLSALRISVRATQMRAKINKANRKCNKNMNIHCDLGFDGFLKITLCECVYVCVRLVVSCDCADSR